MNLPAPTDGDYIKTWLLFFLSMTVGGFIAGAVGGGFLGFALGIAGMSPASHSFRMLCGLAGFIASLPVNFFLFRFFVARLITRACRVVIDNRPA